MASVKTYSYKLPDSGKTLMLSGSSAFINDMSDMLDIMTHSPTALKLLNFYPQKLSDETIQKLTRRGGHD